jgi:hypothetical protein
MGHKLLRLLTAKHNLLQEARRRQDASDPCRRRSDYGVDMVYQCRISLSSNHIAMLQPTSGYADGCFESH